jgi:hypothetical protein
MDTLKCGLCEKTPDQDPSYVEAAAAEGLTPEEYVRQEEGTFNAATGLYACDDCYIKLGAPFASPRWQFGMPLSGPNAEYDAALKAVQA